MSSDGPLLLIVSSPSGAGKTTLANGLLDRIEGITFSVSHTTRKPRAGEQQGREYHFVERKEFVELIESGAFLEWAEVHQNLYGTSKAELQNAGSARGILFDIDHQGARQIKSARPDAIAVFILPPNMDVLRQRLAGRGTESEESLRIRFTVASSEIAHYGLFDYVVVNDDVDRALGQLKSIINAEECRRDRAAAVAERLLTETRGFGGTVPPRS